MHPYLNAIDEMPEHPPRFLRVDKTYPEWTVGEMYEGMIKFVLVQQDVNGSIFEIMDFKAKDEKPRNLAEEIAEEMKPRVRVAPIIVPSPSE